MYNILEVEDKIKGLPDQALMREAQFPSGDVPQFLVVSEIQRRNEMRKSYDAMQQPSSTVPVAQQIVAEAGQGISGIVGGNALPVSAPMQAQTPMTSPMQSSMAAPQAPAGIVGMQSGRTVPNLYGLSSYSGPSEMLINNAALYLADRMIDPSEYSREELESIGRRISLNAFDPLSRRKMGEAAGDLVAPLISATEATVDTLSDLPSNIVETGEAVVDAGRYVKDAASEAVDYVREDEGLGVLGGVLRGSYNLMADKFDNMFAGTPMNAVTVPQVAEFDSGDMTGQELQQQLASLDQAQPSPNLPDVTPTIAQQDTQTSSPQDISINMPALSGSQGLAGFNIPAGRAVTTDISKLIDKEIFGGTGQISADDIVSGLTRGAGDIELPAGADFASIAKARAERSEAASTRMEELIQSIQDKAKSDALNMALINIGAGVASGDLAGGLERAGSVAGQISSDARDAARALELQQITMAEEGARSSEDIQMQEALSDLQRFSVEQGIAKDQRDYNLSLIRTRIEADLGLRKLAADLTQSENISKRSVLSLISDVIKEEAEAAENVGEPYDAASRALTLYNPFAGLFGLDSLSTAELNNALATIGTQSAVETDPADLEAALDSFISR